jgi:hypothetical protein
VRYQVGKPVPGGYSWYRVVDTEDPSTPGAEVLTVREDVGGAFELCELVAHQLNDGSRRAGLLGAIMGIR